MVNVFTGAMNSNLTFHSLVTVHLSAIAMTKHTLSFHDKGNKRSKGNHENQGNMGKLIIFPIKFTTENNHQF